MGFFDPAGDLCFDCTNKDILKKREENDEARRLIAEHDQKIAQAVLVTTETYSPDLTIIERKGIVTAEVVVGMNVFKDLFAGIRNIVGGRSGVVQDALRDIRQQVINELKVEAARSGANAVIAVDLDYQEIGATGSTMLMLVASGTAVVLDCPSSNFLEPMGV